MSPLSILAQQWPELLVHCEDQKKPALVLVTYRIKCVRLPKSVGVCDVGHERVLPTSLKASLLCSGPFRPLRTAADTEALSSFPASQALYLPAPRSLVILAFGL